MKKLLLVACFLVSSANAGTLATMKNDAGGLIVMTDTPCSDGKSWIGYSEIPSSDTIFGCWFGDDMMIHFQWSNGAVRSYPHSLWKINPNYKKPQHKKGEFAS